MVDHQTRPSSRASTNVSAPLHMPGDAALLQTQARQLKYELKTWEAKFAKEHGRAPSKLDLIDMTDITEKYKCYSRIKKSLGRRSSNVNEGAIIHKQEGSSEVSAPRLYGNYKSSRIDLPLETSTLRGSIKRKARHVYQEQLMSQPAGLPTTMPLSTSPRPATSPNKIPSTSNLKDDLVAASVFTPKRQRMALSFDLAEQNKAVDLASPRVSCVFASESPPPAPTGQFGGDVDISDATCTSSFAIKDTPGGFGDGDCDMVTYTPAPSLIRRYGTFKRGIAQSLTTETSSTDPQPAYSPLLPSLSAMSVCDDAQSYSEANSTNTNLDSLDLGTSIPLFKSRAGKLVKTTSIPLSTFGAQLKNASRPLALQRNEDGGNQEAGPFGLLEGYPDQLDSGELVMDDPKDASLQPEEDGTYQNMPKKKTTQKRSTRRVKIKPIDDKESATKSSKRSLRSNPQNLVSSNFYKLKLKSRKRGSGSSEERRTALYKRMVGKQKKSSLGPNTIEGTREYSAEFDYKASVYSQEQNNGHLGTGNPYSDEYLPNSEPASGSEHGKTSTSTQAQLEDIACTISGESLSSFYVDLSSDVPAACLTSSSFSAGLAGVPKDKMLDLCKVLRHVWGFDRFRQNQLEAIKQILNGYSTLLVLATGSGKSLVYQLPALVLSALFGGVTLVVTPLISLMRDQVQSLPSCLQAVCMSSEFSFGDSYADAKARLMSGKTQLLFVSPERMQSPRFKEMMAADGMPTINFAVIDEAHCASEWSHNFRPAYLQLPQALQKIGVDCVLAMTGTATYPMANRLCAMFGINADDGIVRGSAVRDNIELGVVRIDMDTRSASRTSVREEALVDLLKSTEMAKHGSVLVYVSTQANADRVAEYLTARSIPAQAYHAGKPASERARIQKAFMRKSRHKPGSRNEIKDAQGSDVPIRVLVATVAFGMGLDKSDIRAVIHFNIPRSMEAYVQEVGRAGRDGAPACGILILTTDVGKSLLSTDKQLVPQSVDAVFIRSWAHADGIDVVSIRRLLHRLFPSDFMQKAIAAAVDAYSKSLSPQSGEWSVSATTVLELKTLERDVDADHTVIQTLISCLALKEPGMIQTEPNTHRKCRIRPVRTNLGKLADLHVFFKGLVDYLNGGGGSSSTKSVRARQPGTFVRIPGARKTEETLVVDIFELAAHLCTTPSDITAELYKWRAKKEVVLEWQEPSIVVNITLNMSRFALELTSLDEGCSESTRSVAADTDLLHEQLAQLVDRYITDLSEQINQQHGARICDSIRHVNVIEATMLEAAPLESRLQNKLIQASIRSYFSASNEDEEQDAERNNSLSSDTNMVGAAAVPVDADIRNYICKFIRQHLDKLSSGRAVARVLHGLSSPSSPASQWTWCAEWGSLVWTDFEAVRLCAQEELVKVRFAGMDS